MYYTSNNQVKRNPRSFIDSTRTFKPTARPTLVQPKASPIGQRIRTLQELVYETFVGNLRPLTGPKSRPRPDYFYHAKNRIRDLAVKGGPDYEHALTAVKYAYVGQTYEEKDESYRDAVHAVIPPLE
jgi:hypothetical protein